MGLLLDLLEPIRKKIGIHVGHPQELRCWSTKLLDALALVRAAKTQDVSAPKQRHWQFSQRRVEPGPEEISGSLECAPGKRASLPPHAVRSRGPSFVPRCAIVPPKENKPSNDDTGSHLHLGNKRKSMKLLVHSPPESHAVRGGGVVINTHRAGQHAHANIQRDRLTNPKDSRILPVSPQGPTREIPRNQEPGLCDWKKIGCEDSGLRARSASPQKPGAPDSAAFAAKDPA